MSLLLYLLLLLVLLLHHHHHHCFLNLHVFLVVPFFFVRSYLTLTGNLGYCLIYLCIREIYLILSLSVGFRFGLRRRLGLWFRLWLRFRIGSNGPLTLNICLDNHFDLHR